MTECLTPDEWCAKTGVDILDPDGWRSNNPFGPRSWNEPITRDEFIRRAALCTVRSLDLSLFRTASEADQ